MGKNLVSKKYYITLTGAKKNIGDFLITARCEALIQSIAPEYELIKLPHWEALDNRLDFVNDSCGIIIFGGPGYQKNMYPGVYKLTKNLSNIKVPIIPIGLGWKGIPGDFETISEYKFNETSLELLKKISESNHGMGCRDYYTAKVLRDAGIPNVVMTGCPVWYHLDSLGKEFYEQKIIRKIVFTPAQMKGFSSQSVEVMKLLRNKFPKAEIYCSFHRGIGIEDSYTQAWDAKNTSLLSEKAKELGLIPVDTSYELNRIDFYKDCDLHVGYRVHAHICFLSMRKPSLLINEDGRGRGVAEALNINGIDGFKRLRNSNALDKIPKIRVFYKKLFPIIGLNRSCVDEVDFQLDSDIYNNFVRYTGVGHLIDNHFKIMKEYIRKSLSFD